MSIEIYVFVCMDVSMYVCMYVYVYMNVYMFSYISMHGYMYMYIKTTKKFLSYLNCMLKNQYKQEQEFQWKTCLSTHNHYN
jgi:hypothetical protein